MKKIRYKIQNNSGKYLMREDELLGKRKTKETFESIKETFDNWIISKDGGLYFKCAVCDNYHPVEEKGEHH